MVFFSQQMLQIAVELALHDPLYEDFVVKFFEHTMWISGAMDRIGTDQDELWDEEDGFFYDVLQFPDGTATRIKVGSLVGLLSLMAVVVFPRKLWTNCLAFGRSRNGFLRSTLSCNTTSISPPNPVCGVVCCWQF